MSLGIPPFRKQAGRELSGIRFPFVNDSFLERHGRAVEAGGQRSCTSGRIAADCGSCQASLKDRSGYFNVTHQIAEGEGRGGQYSQAERSAAFMGL